MTRKCLKHKITDSAQRQKKSFLAIQALRHGTAKRQMTAFMQAYGKQRRVNGMCSMTNGNFAISYLAYPLSTTQTEPNTDWKLVTVSS